MHLHFNICNSNQTCNHCIDGEIKLYVCIMYPGIFSSTHVLICIQATLHIGPLLLAFDDSVGEKGFPPQKEELSNEHLRKQLLQKQFLIVFFIELIF